jgi:hypothetical protein
MRFAAFDLRDLLEAGGIATLQAIPGVGPRMPGVLQSSRTERGRRAPPLVPANPGD